jgi:hypothetical protein
MSNYHFTYREKSIIRPLGRIVYRKKPLIRLLTPQTFRDVIAELPFHALLQSYLYLWSCEGKTICCQDFAPTRTTASWPVFLQTTYIVCSVRIQVYFITNFRTRIVVEELLDIQLKVSVWNAFVVGGISSNANNHEDPGNNAKSRWLSP